MNLEVEYLDRQNNSTTKKIYMSRLAFAKHLAIAGQGYMPSPKKLLRTIGMFLHYSFYLKRQEFQNNHFAQPPNKLSDPTEKGHFSNLAGKAIADFLSKRLNNSLLTVGYESEMKKRGLK